MLRNTMYLGGGAVKIPMTVTGTGNATRCYITLSNGTVITRAGNYEVAVGDTVTFTVVYSDYSSWVTLNGETLFYATSSNSNYEWEIPDDISAIGIELWYNNTTTQTVIRITTA